METVTIAKDEYERLKAIEKQYDAQHPSLHDLQAGRITRRA